jgi:2',3'-cyclic-nucleotide 2'-phosphodiesterase (5'-nucleotidase family)
LISLLTDQPGLYRPNSFGGAKIEDPWETARVYNKKLLEEDKVDLIVPLCHLYEPQDEKTCREFDCYPVIISGHDHHTVNRVIHGSRLVKAGSDGHMAAIVDITWESAETVNPEITVDLVPVANWAPDATLQAQVTRALSVLDNLRHTQLVSVPEKFRPLNSVGTRGAVTTMGLFLCSQYRDAFNEGLSATAADLVLMPGGNIRGGRLYRSDDYFSLESLYSEVHPSTLLSVVELPGAIICEAIRDSHTRGNHPYYMHYDDFVVVDSESHLVTHIGGEALDLSRIYNVVYPTNELFAQNGPACIREYFTLHPPNTRHLSSTARGGQEFLLQFWVMFYNASDCCSIMLFHSTVVSAA